MSEDLNKIRKHFIGSDGVNLDEIEESMKLDDGRKVTSVHDGYVSVEDENGEWVNDIPFESLTDVELTELALIVDNLKADDEKTAKRIAD